MKTIFITSIAILALTSAATAHTWMWFQGDIGTGSSPFVSSSPRTNNVAAQAATKKKSDQKRAVTKVKSKSKSADHRITAR
jgi:hypothetical protein